MCNMHVHAPTCTHPQKHNMYITHAQKVLKVYIYFKNVQDDIVRLKGKIQVKKFKGRKFKEKNIDMKPR